MPAPAWVRRDLGVLRARREAFETIAAGEDAGADHARTMAALCRLISAVLMDHGDEPGPQLALAATWVDGLDRLEHELAAGGRLDSETAAQFREAVAAQLESLGDAASLPGPAMVLLGPIRPRRNRLGPFEDLARRLRHKGAIDALQYHLPTFEPRSPLVDAAMDRAVESARQTGLDGFPDGRDRIARTAVLESAADAVEGLALARPWLERVDDPLLHPGSTILFQRVERRLRAGRALAALDVLRVRPEATEAMGQLREAVEEAVEAGQVHRAVDVLDAHGPALEAARALLDADDVGLNRMGASIAGQVGRALPRRATVLLLDRLRRVADLSTDPLAAELVAAAVREGDVDEDQLIRIEAMREDSPIELHTVPTEAQARQALDRRVAGF